MLKPRVMTIVLNFQINEVLSVLRLYLVNISAMFSILCIYIPVLCYSLILCIYVYIHIMFVANV